MNGPTHYTKAQNLLAEAVKASPDRKATLAARAQAHATLALAAATLGVPDSGVHQAGTHKDWTEAMKAEPEVPEKKPSTGHLM